MPTPDMSLSDLLAALGAHRERHLTEQRLHNIGSYGWLDADSVDPEYSGHAIWQTRPPSEADWLSMFEGGVPRYEPTDTQLALVQSGEDFTGAMCIARLNAGFALCINESLPLGNVADDEYWMHIATANLWLGIASDRIRDYLTLTCFGVLGDKYPYVTKNGDTWATPFFKVIPLDVAEEQQQTKLAALAEAVRAHRGERHTIIHRVATSTARRMRAILAEQQKLAREHIPYPSPTTLTFEGLQQLELDTAPGEERENAFRKVVSWYDSLAEISNIVFRLEYDRRPRTG